MTHLDVDDNGYTQISFLYHLWIAMCLQDVGSDSSERLFIDDREKKSVRRLQTAATKWLAFVTRRGSKYIFKMSTLKITLNKKLGREISLLLRERKIHNRDSISHFFFFLWKRFYKFHLRLWQIVRSIRNSNSSYMVATVPVPQAFRRFIPRHLSGVIWNKYIAYYFAKSHSHIQHCYDANQYSRV